MNNNLLPSRPSTRLFIYFAIGIVISYIMPFPFSFLTILGTVILITIYIREKVLNIVDLGISIATTLGRRRLTYYCMTCGTQHRDIVCPRCGSRIKKV
jgi:ABC-type uncharacterized transport system permease subunit